MTATDTIDGVVGSFLEDQKDHSYDRQDSWTNNMRKNRSATGDDFGSQYTRCNDQDYSDNLFHLVLSLYASLLGSRHADRFSTHDQSLPRCSPPLKERLEVVNSTSVQLHHEVYAVEVTVSQHESDDDQAHVQREGYVT